MEMRQAIGAAVGIIVAIVVALYLVGALGSGVVQYANTINSTAPQVASALQSSLTQLLGGFGQIIPIAVIAVILTLIFAVPGIKDFIEGIFKGGGGAA